VPTHVYTPNSPPTAGSGPKCSRRPEVGEAAKSVRDEVEIAAAFAADAERVDPATCCGFTLVVSRRAAT
jgi:hypothetical protein